MGGMIRRLICLVLVVGGLSGVAYGQFAKPDDAIAYRKAVMVLSAQHFGRMGAMVKGEKPFDQKVFSSNAFLVSTFSRLPWEAFMVPGSDQGSTAMKPEALKEKGKFEQVAKAFENAAAALNATAASGNLDSVKDPFGKAAQSCKECHSQFKR
jgi:cytochrome c556